MSTKGVLHRAAILAVAALSAGCVVQHPNGPPPDPRQFVLGETTEAQVIGRLGEAQRRSEQVLTLPAFKDHPARRIVIASVTYGAALIRGHLLEGGTTFSFRDGTLVSYQTGGVSRPGFDGYDFDRVRDLLANKSTTRSDVVALLGDPSSRALLSTGDIGSTGERDTYLFIAFVGFGTAQRIYKTIVVAYDASGHVISYNLNETRR